MHDSFYLPGPQEKCKRHPCRMCRVMAMFGRPMGHKCCARVAPDQARTS